MLKIICKHRGKTDDGTQTYLKKGIRYTSHEKDFLVMMDESWKMKVLKDVM
jgi:hypothetical protein